MAVNWEGETTTRSDCGVFAHGHEFKFAKSGLCQERDCGFGPAVVPRHGIVFCLDSRICYRLT
jgi:hypothetical protein